MRLVDFLILLLETQADTLKRLAALFGEDILLQILEASEDRSEKSHEVEDSPVSPEDELATRMEEPRGTAKGSAYTEIAGAVREFQLASVLEFHLWAYPTYRRLIESGLELESRVPAGDVETANLLLAPALRDAQTWIRKLPIAKEFRAQAESAAQVPWVKFRASVLKKIGQRPLTAL